MNSLHNSSVEYTQRNHLRYTFLDQIHDKVQGHDLVVTVGNPQRNWGLLREEAILAAKEIYEKMPKPLVLCLSSGIDSQCLYEAFVAAQVPFEIATFRYHCQGLRDLNIEDTSWVMNNLRFRGHRLQEINIDLFDFYFGSEHWEIADEAQCQSPQLTCHMRAMSLIEGTPILSWNIPNIYRSKSGHPAIYVPNSKYFSYQRFLQSRNKPGVPFFFLYTPELFFSSLSLETVRTTYRDCAEKNIKLNHPRKLRAYKEGGFLLEFIPNRKRTGFELFKTWLADYTGGVDWTYDLLFRTPLELKYPRDAHVHLKVSAAALQEALALTPR